MTRRKRWSALTAIAVAVVVPAVVARSVPAKKVPLQARTQGVSPAFLVGDCRGARPGAWFNSPSSWGTGPGRIGPGDTVELCGTITSPLSVPGSESGTVGNPITIRFQTDAKIAIPACGTCFWAAGGNKYLVIDGGVNGQIEETDNGSTPGHSHDQDSTGLNISTCLHCTVENLQIGPLYDHTVSSESTPEAYGIAMTGTSDLTIRNNYLHDLDWAIFGTIGDGDRTHFQNMRIYGNTCDNFNACVSIGLSASLNSGPWLIHNNHFENRDKWDVNPGGGDHHNALHFFGNRAHSSGFYYYDNISDGKLGGYSTSGIIFIEAGDAPTFDTTTPVYIFNNVGIEPDQSSSGNLDAGTGNLHAYNNALIGYSGTDPRASGFACWQRDDGFANTTCTFENNVSTKAGHPIQWFSPNQGTWVPGQPDYNVYENCPRNDCFACADNHYPAFSSWQACVGADTHSRAVNDPRLNADGSPRVGSPVIDAGANLTSLCTGYLAPLCTDINGYARPTDGPWDAGAFNWLRLRPRPPRLH